jgi:GTP diphosphokinase / guanosine-3',5'-bis(diphosphate) 3'-diphosphatase
MESRQDFLNDIMSINPKYNEELIGKAFDVAERMHTGQMRKSGEPYFIHPMSVTKILAELGMDDSTLVAGLLHDVVEDTSYSDEDLAKDFGEEVRILVDGVTKLGTLAFDNKEEKQAENLRKMFLAMSKDIRVLIIKLADTLHNLRTINYLSPEKVKEKSRDTLEIYAPLASRLGMYALKFELEDIALENLYPDAYEKLVSSLAAKKEERQQALDHIVQDIIESLDDLNIRYEISGRTKNLYSIYKKMEYQHKSLDEIFDLMAVRIIVESVKDCYAVLGIVHTLWTPIPGRFKDYIAMPKQNLYQSIHTTVIGDSGRPFEIQIRTYEMHRVAEYGIAAHWKYKEGIASDNEEVKLAWLRQSLEWQKDMDDPKEFMESLKVDLFENQVFVFTPKGDVLELPAGSTPLDFAFKIHSGIGEKCVGAKVNGKMVPIDHQLENGTIVEIVTSPNSRGPSIDWLKIAKSSTARNKIRQFLRRENKSGDIEKGKDIIDKYVRKKGYEPRLVLRNMYIIRYVKENKLSGTDELYSQIANGGSYVSKVATALFKYYNEDKKEDIKKETNDVEILLDEKTKKDKSHVKDKVGVTVKGIDNLMIRVSRCCNPVPGDEIVGYITKGRGISVHRKDCTNITSLPEEEQRRFIEVEWDTTEEKSYNADITVIAEDRKGLFSDISKACENMDVHISGVNAKSSKEKTIHIVLTLSISNTAQMKKILRTLHGVSGVSEVYRAKS